MIQQGNDLTLIWKITDPRGGEVNLSTFDTYEVLIESDYSNNVVKANTSAQGSELTFVFKAKDQEATGYYSLIFNATQNGKGFRVEAPRVIELEGARAAKAETGNENNILRVTSTLAVYLGGRDGMSPYIGTNGNWWVFSDETKVYVDTGIKADYTGENDAAMAELKAATDAAVLINTSIQKDEVARVANEDTRITNENTRKSNETERVKAEAARDAKYNQINTAEKERVKSEQDRVINEDLRISNEDQRIANEADRVKRFAALESEVDNAASMAIAAGNTAIAQGNTAAAQGVKAESQGNTAATQGNDAKAKGDAAKTQGDYAKAQGDYAKSEAGKVAGDIANLKTGKLDKPTNEGEVDMVLTKTATGSEWQPSKGGAGSGFYGLGFKSGDNSVNLTTPKIDLGLNDFTIEIWARMEGLNYSFPILGSSKKEGAVGVLKLYNDPQNGTNGIRFATFENGSKLLSILKTDNTTNLHHIVITRQGTLVTAIINGRLIKTVTQDRVLDFSEFVFDIANTTYFSLGRVFNYAMSNDEAISLWNGGRVDEVVLSDTLYKEGKQDYFKFNHNISTGQMVFENKTDNANGFTGEYTKTYQNNNNGIDWYTSCSPNVNDNFKNSKINITIKYRCNYDMADSLRNVVLPKNTNDAKIITLTAYSINNKCFDLRTVARNEHQFMNRAIGYTNDGVMEKPFVEIQVLDISKQSCLLELLPSSIHSKGIYNTGSLGESHNAVLSKPDETIFIKEKQYKDKQTTTTAPDFHPIAMGQECTDQKTGNIYKASVPPVGREWAVADWKQINK